MAERIHTRGATVPSGPDGINPDEAMAAGVVSPDDGDRYGVSIRCASNLDDGVASPRRCRVEYLE